MYVHMSFLCSEVFICSTVSKRFAVTVWGWFSLMLLNNIHVRPKLFPHNILMVLNSKKVWELWEVKTWKNSALFNWCTYITYFFSGITFLFWGDCLKFVSTPSLSLSVRHLLALPIHSSNLKDCWRGIPTTIRFLYESNQIQSRSEIRNEFFNQADPLNRGVCEDPGAPQLSTEGLVTTVDVSGSSAKDPPNHSGGRFYPSYVFPLFSYVALLGSVQPPKKKIPHGWWQLSCWAKSQPWGCPRRHRPFQWTTGIGWRNGETRCRASGHGIFK